MMKNPSFEDFKGYTQKQKTINEIYDYVKEDRIKTLGYMDKYLPLSLITAFNPDTEEITDVGCSVPNDLVNTNFGEFFAGCFSPSGSQTKVLKDITNTNRTINTYGTQSAPNIPYNSTTNNSYLTQVQVGTGTTTPDRDDYNIETAFANGGLEDSRQNTNNGSHIPDNSTVQVGKVITPTTGSGTVQESCLFGQYRLTNSTSSATFLLSRDLVTISFGAGQSISVVYVWNL